MSFICVDPSDDSIQEIVDNFLLKRIGKKVALSLFTKTFDGEVVSTEPINVTCIGTRKKSEALDGIVYFAVDLKEIASVDDTLY